MYRNFLLQWDQTWKTEEPDQQEQQSTELKRTKVFCHNSKTRNKDINYKHLVNVVDRLRKQIDTQKKNVNRSLKFRYFILSVINAEINSN